MTTLDVCAVSGLAPSTLQAWVIDGFVTPPEEGGKGRGNSRKFTTMQAVGLGVAGHLRATKRGCVLSYVGKVVAAFAAMPEKELIRQLAEGKTHFVFEHYGRPMLDGEQNPEWEWPNVKAIYEAVLAAQ